MLRNQLQWGQQVVLPEPGINAPPVRRGFASIGEQVVESPVDAAGLRAQEVPAPRDWTIYFNVATDAPRIAAPVVVAQVRYGSGGSVFRREQRVPVVGCVMHVVATHLDVEAELRTTGLPAAGNVTIGAYVAVGRPSTQRVQVADFLATTPGTYQIPPYATGGLFWEADNGAANSLVTVWQYQGINRGVTAPSTAPQWSQAQGVPQDADSVLILPTRNNINLFWEVFS